MNLKAKLHLNNEKTSSHLPFDETVLNTLPIGVCLTDEGETLMILSTFINDNIRAGDIAYLDGGGEFIIVMPGAGTEVANNRAETICQAFKATPIHDGGTQSIATISAGISIYPEHGRNSNEILRSADSALYQAKQAGRNHVRVWSMSASGATNNA